MSRLRFPLLLMYIALLVLAGWREEIRPGWLDAPSRFAVRALGRIGVLAGDPVFSSPVDLAGREHSFRAYCLEVRGREAGAVAERVYPDRGVCPPAGVRLRVPAEKVMLTRLMLWAAADEAERRMAGLPPPPPGFGTLSDVLMRSVVSHFRLRNRLGGEPRDELSLLFAHHMVHLDTGEEFVQPVVFFRAERGRPPERVVWGPTPAQLPGLWRGNDRTPR